jgi:rubrerythrin
MPFRIVYSARLTYRISAALPERWDIENRSKTITDSAFLFSYLVECGNKDLYMEYKYIAKRDLVPKEEMQTYIKNVGEALSHIGYSLYYYPSGSGRMSWIFYTIIGMGLVIGTFLIGKVSRQPAKNFNELAEPEIHPQQLQETEEVSIEYQCSKCGFNVFKTDQICPHCNTSLKDNITIIEKEAPVTGGEAEYNVQIKEDTAKPTVYKGIRGWLIFPAIGLIYSLIRLPWGTATALFPLSKQSVWDQITTPGLPTYHPMFGPMLIGELVINFALIILTIITAIYFFRKMHQAPRFMIILLLSSAGILIIDSILVNASGINVYMTENSNSNEIIRIIPVAIIWTLYFLRSRRVKATFIR